MEILVGPFALLEARRAGIAAGRRSYGDNQRLVLPGDDPHLFRAVTAILVEAGILASVEAYRGRAVSVQRLAPQINDACDGFWTAPFADLGLPIPPTAFMHIDNTVNVTKALIYLSDVDRETGPFSYVPGTHLARMGLWEGLVRRAVDLWRSNGRPENRRLILALPRWLRQSAKFGDDLAPDSDEARNLLAAERVVTSVDGDLILFDVNVVHRGGMVARGERRVLQVSMW
jgi:ectoine hydroxylase-related dioxygenase (phytanoyl-CoA dioxygenase family)